MYSGVAATQSDTGKVFFFVALCRTACITRPLLVLRGGEWFHFVLGIFTYVFHVARKSYPYQNETMHAVECMTAFCIGNLYVRDYVARKSYPYQNETMHAVSSAWLHFVLTISTYVIT